MPNPLIHTTDWNIMIILDAMRYDYFKEYHSFKGSLQKVETQESCTGVWLNRNFSYYYDYIYVSGNPYITKKIPTRDGWIGGEHFTKIIEVWKDGWSKKHKTVLPSAVSKAAKKYLSEEKVIIHYLQPHMPGIGSQPLRVWGWIPDEKAKLGFRADPNSFKINSRVVSVLLPRAYKSNVEVVLKEVEELIKEIPISQKIVITSDHGEMLGEQDFLLHPCSLLHPLLTKVPWFEVEA